MGRGGLAGEGGEARTHPRTPRRRNPPAKVLCFWRAGARGVEAPLCLAVSASRLAPSAHALRGRNGETGLNPFRCLAKLDTCGCVSTRGPDRMPTRPPRPAWRLIAFTNSSAFSVPSSARPSKGRGPSCPWPKVLNGRTLWTAHRTSQVSRPERRDRGGLDPAPPEAGQLDTNHTATRRMRADP